MKLFQQILVGGLAMGISAYGLVPPEYQPFVEYQSKLTIGSRTFDVVKLNRSEQSFSEAGFDEKGKLIPIEQLREQYIKQFSQFGKIHPTLLKLMAQSPTQSLSVMVWLKTPPRAALGRPLSSDGLDEAIKKLEIENEKSLVAFRERKKFLVQSLGLQQNEFESDLDGTPFIVANLKVDRIKALSVLASTQALMFHDIKALTDLSDAMAIAGAGTVHSAGIKADGIKVAVFENCPDDTTNLVISGKYSTSIGSSCTASDHARHVTGIIRNNQAVSGFAPNATVFSADKTLLAALTWAIDTKKVSAINQSFHRAAEIGDGMQADDFFKDYKVLHYPWPMIVHAAGNWCPTGSSCFEGGSDILAEYVNHKSYNTISVGNHNDNATEMSASSVFRNPSTTHSDRELPEIAANGTGVTTVGLTKSGTSMSSPATMGSAALIQKTDSVLKIWPEGVRAILSAGSTRNVPKHPAKTSGGADATTANSTWFEDLRNDRDGYDGAGALNVAESVAIAKNRYKGGSLERGYDIGTFRADSFDTLGFAKKTYKVHVPSGSSKKHLKVGLAWNSTATITAGSPAELFASTLDMDLDIRIYNSAGTLVAKASSYDNSYEVADLNATPGETYTIKIKRYTMKPGSWSWFGIAWTLTNQ